VLDHVAPATTTTLLRRSAQTPEWTSAACALDTVDATEDGYEPEPPVPTSAETAFSS